MTIAVSAKFPWDNLNKLFPVKAKGGEGIVLISDCRITQKLGSRYFCKSDMGTKIFQLGTDVAAVYAGISSIGEKCIDELRYALARQQPGSANSIKTAQKVFQNVYTHNLALIKLKPQEAPLYFMIGACSKHGKAELYRSSYNSDFALEHIVGLNVIAWTTTKNMFNNLMNRELGHQAKLAKYQYSHLKNLPEFQKYDTQTSINIEQLGILMVSVLTRVIEFSQDETVGGKVQCVLITRNGVITPIMSYTTNGTNQGAEWIQATAEQTRLETETGISNVFGFYDFSE